MTDARASPALLLVFVLGCGRIGFDLAGDVVPSDAPPGLPTCATGCGGDEFCAAPPFNCAGAPACVITPSSCSPTSDPVCGCDGLTYLNECEANRAGISASLAGACPALANPTCTPPCNADQFCSTRTGVCNTQPGTCEPKPSPQDCDLPAAVCGCDGVTYFDPCDAAIAGASLLSFGACGGSGDRERYRLPAR